MYIEFRPQTYLLIVAALLMLATPFVTSWEKYSTDKTEHAILNGLKLVHTRTDSKQAEVVIQESNKLPILLSSLVSAGLCGYIITQGRKRLMQMKLGIGNSLAMAITLSWIFFAIPEGEAWIEPSHFGIKGLGFYFPFIALLLNMISNRLIRRDEKLVRSMHRMR